MPYVLPPNNLIASLLTNEDRRRKLYEADLKLRDWTNTDPGRGPVRGWGGRR